MEIECRRSPYNQCGWLYFSFVLIECSASYCAYQLFDKIYSVSLYSIYQYVLIEFGDLLGYFLIVSGWELSLAQFTIEHAAVTSLRRITGSVAERVQCIVKGPALHFEEYMAVTLCLIFKIPACPTGIKYNQGAKSQIRSDIAGELKTNIVNEVLLWQPTQGNSKWKRKVNTYIKRVRDGINSHFSDLSNMMNNRNADSDSRERASNASAADNSEELWSPKCWPDTACLFLQSSSPFSRPRSHSSQIGIE